MERNELRALLIQEALFKEKITLSSGKQSDYYIDARRVTLNSRGVYLAARLILDTIKDDSFDAIGGPTLGADALLGAIAALRHQEDKPLNTFIIRKSPKAYGKQQQIEGPTLKEGQKVVLIDDVATTGKSILQSIDVLSAMNVKVLKAVCLVDRDEGATEALAKKGCPLIVIFKAKDLLN